jgi:hypothetical protein
MVVNICESNVNSFHAYKKSKFFQEIIEKMNREKKNNLIIKNIKNTLWAEVEEDMLAKEQKSAKKISGSYWEGKKRKDRV